MKNRFKLSYNAPVTLTFSLFCVFIMALDYWVTDHKTIPLLFMVPGNKAAPSPFDWGNALSYIRLFTHVAGHADWQHLLGNLSFILLLGPLMEEKYGSSIIALMFTVTAFVTGVVNACFIPASLMGASSISFMLILLTAISTISRNEIPFSFIFIIAVYIARELISPSDSSISTIAHITGGCCGSLFGFLTVPKKSKTEKIVTSKSKKNTDKLTASQKIARLKEIDEASPRRNSSKTDSSNDDKTIEIGTIEL